MTRIGIVINDEHSVQAHDVVVEGLLSTVIVEPEGAHLFPCIAIPAKRIESGVAIRVEIVFPEAAWEEVARKPIAFGTMVSVMQVDRYLGMAKRVVSIRRRAVPEPHDGGFAISIQDRGARIDTIETPNVTRTEVGVELVQAGSGFQFGGYVSWRELSPALMCRTVPFTRI